MAPAHQSATVEPASRHGRRMPPRARRGKHPAWTLTCLLGGMFLGHIDIAVVNVAIPSIRQNLRTSGAVLALIVSGYTLAYATLLITGARLGDIRGRRRIFSGGLSTFTFFSLVCGLAPDAATLVAARILQGVGAALMVPQVLTAVQVNFEGTALRRARAAYIIVLGAAAVIGQALGGIIVSADVLGLGWRPVFLINVPIGVFLVIASWIFLPDEQTQQKKLDPQGVALLTAGLFLLVVPLSLGQDAGWPPWTWLCLGGCVPVLALFVWWERKVAERGRDPLMNVALLARKRVSLLLSAQGVNRACYFALLFVLSLYLQQGLGKSPTYAGLLPISYMFTFSVTGPVLDRLGVRVRKLAAQLGGLLIAAAFAAMAVGGQSTLWLIVLLGASGMGYGAAFGAVVAYLTESVGAEYAPDVSGLFNTTLQVGGATGVAVFSTVYLSGFARSTARESFNTTNLALAAASIVSCLLIVLAARTKASPRGGSRVRASSGGVPPALFDEIGRVGADCFAAETTR